MDPETSLVVAVIGAVSAGIVGPIVGLAALYINRKFDSKITELQNRVQACEDRHAALDAAKPK